MLLFHFMVLSLLAESNGPSLHSHRKEDIFWIFGHVLVFYSQLPVPLENAMLFKIIFHFKMEISCQKNDQLEKMDVSEKYSCIRDVEEGNSNSQHLNFCSQAEEVKRSKNWNEISWKIRKKRQRDREIEMERACPSRQASRIQNNVHTHTKLATNVYEWANKVQSGRHGYRNCPLVWKVGRTTICPKDTNTNFNSFLSHTQMTRKYGAQKNSKEPNEDRECRS